MKIDDIEVAPGVQFPEKRRKRPGCAMLDTADRLSAILGAPARKLYYDIVKEWERFKHSDEEQVHAVYHNNYSYLGQAMWYDLSAMVPGPGRSVSPELYKPAPSPIPTPPQFTPGDIDDMLNWMEAKAIPTDPADIELAKKFYYILRDAAKDRLMTYGQEMRWTRVLDKYYAAFRWEWRWF